MDRPEELRTAGDVLLDALAQHKLEARWERSGGGHWRVVHDFDGGRVVFSNGRRADYQPSEHEGWTGTLSDQGRRRVMVSPPSADCAQDSARAADSYAKWLRARGTVAEVLMDALWSRRLHAVVVEWPRCGSDVTLAFGPHLVVITDGTDVLHPPADYCGWVATLIDAQGTPLRELFRAPPHGACAPDSQACAQAVAEAFHAEFATRTP